MILIISPHMDDEVYGCSSFLADDVTVLYMTSVHPLFPDGENKKENGKLIEKLKFRSLYFDFPTNQLDTIKQLELIATLEKVINQIKPELILLPFPSYNQDHRAVYEATMTATRRHDKNHFVKRILLYEQPETWDSFRKDFNPTYFKPVNISFKQSLFHVYKSQIRGHRSMEHIKAIAKVRGMQANMEYAEAFEVVRWVE